MEELVISILLMVVIIMAAALLIFIGSRKDGMTKKQRVMMVRILLSAGIYWRFSLFPQRCLIRPAGIYSRLQEDGFVLCAI